MADILKIYGADRYEDEYISFEAEADDLLMDFDHYEKYVKGIEQMVRMDDRYKAYISKLKSGGLTKCAIFGNLPDDEKIKNEMHHGPIFNLFDYTDIVLRYHLKRGDLVTTFDIADEILKCHEKDWIMVVMLSKAVHRGGAHNKSGKGIFIDIKATFGDICKFIEHYSDGMIDEHWEYIEKYIRECNKASGTEDNDLFQVAEKLGKFK